MQPSSQPIPARVRLPGFAMSPAITDAACPETTLAALDPDAATFTVGRDAVIYAQDDTAQHCFRIVSGCVRTVKLMEDGRRHIDAFLLPGDWFGLEAPATQAFAAEATMPTTLRRYPRHAFDRLVAEDVRLARWLLGIVTAQLRAARAHALALGRNNSTERLACFLLDMRRRLPQERDGAVVLPMSRGDMADHLGITLETVCRGLSRFRENGVINLAAARLVVGNRAALAALAGVVREARGDPGHSTRAAAA